ncbi:MAG TPA: 6-bladed beta-propeller [Pyrinomonadaceae bacterium]|jgi:streptogramin lyase/DNA-directed RNA polymerase subunit RPC12/RpoP
MTQPFKCPSCGAPLSLDNPGATVRCHFCGNSVIVPESLRQPDAAAAPPHSHAASPSLDNIVGQAARLGELGQLIRGGNKIAAIKLYRELFGSSLKDAKDAVERLERGQPIEVMNLSGGAYQNVQINPAQFPPAPPSFQSPPSARGCWLVPVLIILLVIGASVALVAYLSSSKVRETVGSIPFIPSASQGGSAASPDGFASVTQEFGSEGIGPGQFKDARSIGVDGEGRIYAAEYIGGRVQVFDAQGKYLAGWMVDRKMPLRGMAVDRKGIVYITQKGVITRYEGMTGNPLGELRAPGVSRFDDVVATQDGGLLASAYAGGADDIVRFNSNGQVVQTIRKAISGQTEDSELDMRLASDGLGNIYALGTFNRAVFKFTREGRFVTRIGGEGEQPGQFRAPSAIAVDGQGRIFVSDTKGIQVFDTDGRYLDVFKVPNHIAFGLIFNDRNELLSASREKVFKFTINKRK